MHGRKLARDFVLSGWWAADPAFNVSIIVASRAYVDAHLDELYNSYREDMRMTGAINCYIMFKNSLNIEGKLARVIEESGLSMDPDAPNGIATNVNWSYLSANLSMDPSMLLALAAGALLIGFAGYLIIYNIFQISVMQDVRDYGLLQDHRRDRAADSRADSASGARALRGGHTAGPARRLSDGPRAAAGDLAHDHRAGAGGCPGASRDLSGQRDLCARDRAPERASPGAHGGEDFPGGGRALYRGGGQSPARGEARGTARASPRWRCITSAETAAGRR